MLLWLLSCPYHIGHELELQAPYHERYETILVVTKLKRHRKKTSPKWSLLPHDGASNDELFFSTFQSRCSYVLVVDGPDQSKTRSGTRVFNLVHSHVPSWSFLMKWKGRRIGGINTRDGVSNLNSYHVVSWSFQLKMKGVAWWIGNVTSQLCSISLHK